MKTVLFCLLSVFALSSQAACLKDGQTVTLEGVLTTRTVKLNPADFGWVPEHGYVEYTALVIQTPFCIEGEGEKFENEHMIQLGYEKPTFTTEELHKGVSVKVKGQLFLAHTAHHFQTGLISPAVVTRK